MLFKEEGIIVQTEHYHSKDKFDKNNKKIAKAGEKYLKDNKVHKSCAEAFNNVIQENKKENEQWDSLYKYIVRLHDLFFLEKANITRLKDLRAGYELKNGSKIRKWKQGPDYELMLDAYKLADDSIRWCIANTLKGENDVGAINYCMSIMIKKLNEAFARRKNRLRQQEEIKQNLENENNSVVETEVVYKAKINTNSDISNFL